MFELVIKNVVLKQKVYSEIRSLQEHISKLLVLSPMIAKL